MLLSKVINFKSMALPDNQIVLLIKLFLIFTTGLWIFGFSRSILLGEYDFLTNYFLNRIYSPVCHQETSKCFTLGNHSMFVCSRCAGIYFGALLSGFTSLFFQFRNLKVKYLFITIAIMLLDVFSSTLGIYSYTKQLAFGTGLLFGYIIYLFLINEIENFITYKSIKRNE